MMFIRFNVFGQKMSVQRNGSGWLLFRDSDTGIRCRIYDVVIPGDLSEEELPGYLADIYHEYARETHDEVIRL